MSRPPGLIVAVRVAAGEAIHVLTIVGEWMHRDAVSACRCRGWLRLVESCSAEQQRYAIAVEDRNRPRLSKQADSRNCEPTDCDR